MSQPLRNCAVAVVLLSLCDPAFAQQIYYQPPGAPIKSPAPAVAPQPPTTPTAAPTIPLLRSPAPLPEGVTPPPAPRPSSRDYVAKTLQRFQETGDPLQLRLALEAGLPAAEAIPLFTPFLENEKPDVLHTVLWGLRHQYPNDSGAAVPRIVELSGSSDVRVAAVAAETLGYLRPVRQELVLALSAILLSPDTTRDITESNTVDVIRREGDREIRVQEVQTRLRREPDPRIEVKRAAAKGMAALGREAGIHAIMPKTNPPGLDAELGYHLFRCWCNVKTQSHGFPVTPEEEHDYAYDRIQSGVVSPSQIMGFLTRLYPRLPPGRQAAVLEWLRHAHQVPAELTQIVLQEASSRDPFTAHRAMQAADGMTPARGPENIRVIAHYLKLVAQSRDASHADLAEAATKLAVNYGEPAPAFEDIAIYVLRFAAVGGPSAPSRTAVEQALDLLYLNPSKTRASAEAAEKLMSADASCYRGRSPGDYATMSCRYQAAVAAAANGPTGSPEALKCVEEFLTPPPDNSPPFVPFSAAARYIGALPAGPAKERLAAQLVRALDDDFHPGMFYLRRFGQHRFGGGDPLFGEQYSNARIEAMQALATMEAPFLQPLEAKLRQRAQDAPLRYGPAQSHLLAAQMLQKIEAAR